VTISWLRVLIAALCLASCGASQDNRVPGEYIVTLTPQARAAAIADLYGRFAIQSVKPLGNDVYLMQLSEDPGPVVIESLGRSNAHIKAVQPNYGYRTQRK
jgi:hypothetical protein